MRPVTKAAAMSYLLKLGNNISIDYVKVRCSIRGVFEGEEDGFDAAHHEL